MGNLLQGFILEPRPSMPLGFWSGFSQLDMGRLIPPPWVYRRTVS